MSCILDFWAQCSYPDGSVRQSWSADTSSYRFILSLNSLHGVILWPHFSCTAILSMFSLRGATMGPSAHKLRILRGIYLQDMFYSLSTQSRWGMVNVPCVLHDFEHILLSLRFTVTILHASWSIVHGLHISFQALGPRFNSTFIKHCVLSVPVHVTHQDGKRSSLWNVAFIFYII